MTTAPVRGGVERRGPPHIVGGVVITPSRPRGRGRPRGAGSTRGVRSAVPAVEEDAAVRIEAAAVRGEDVQEQEQEQEQVEAGARDSSEVPVVSQGAGEPPAVTVALVAGPELEQIEGDPEEGDHEEE